MQPSFSIRAAQVQIQLDNSAQQRVKHEEQYLEAMTATRPVGKITNVRRKQLEIALQHTPQRQAAEVEFQMKQAEIPECRTGPAFAIRARQLQLQLEALAKDRLRREEQYWASLAAANTAGKISNVRMKQLEIGLQHAPQRQEEELAFFGRLGKGKDVDDTLSMPGGKATEEQPADHCQPTSCVDDFVQFSCPPPVRPVLPPPVLEDLFPSLRSYTSSSPYPRPILAGKLSPQLFTGFTPWHDFVGQVIQPTDSQSQALSLIHI